MFCAVECVDERMNAFQICVVGVFYVTATHSMHMVQHKNNIYTFVESSLSALYVDKSVRVQTHTHTAQNVCLTLNALQTRHNIPQMQARTA